MPAAAMTGFATLLPAHLMGAGWHVADLLLYGGAGVGVALGIALFLWGRVERRRDPDPSDERNGGEANAPPRLVR